MLLMHIIILYTVQCPRIFEDFAMSSNENLLTLTSAAYTADTLSDAHKLLFIR